MCSSSRAQRTSLAEGEHHRDAKHRLRSAHHVPRSGTHRSKKGFCHSDKSPFLMEAPPRFGLGHKGFADLCLTTWLWRRIWSGLRVSVSALDTPRSVADLGIHRIPIQHRSPSRPSVLLKEDYWEFHSREKWSGLRVSNPPPRPWQGRALPNELNPQNFSG